MRYVEGGTLFQYITLRKDKLPEDSARFYGAQVLLALEAMHEKNIIYRDLKLENILLDSQGFLFFSFTFPSLFHLNNNINFILLKFILFVNIIIIIIIIILIILIIILMIIIF